jgi:hypothetical protein
VSLTGDHLALISRRADLGPPEPPGAMMSPDGPTPTTCATDAWSLECQQEYLIEVWTLRGRPHRLWRQRVDLAQRTTRTWPLAKQASGALAFTRDGARLLVGYEDGDLEVRDVATGAARTERLHHAAVTQIETGPEDRWVLSEDQATEQRLWPLIAPPGATGATVGR